MSITYGAAERRGTHTISCCARTVTGALRLKGRVHAAEASTARAHTTRKLKLTLPGPMTIVDTIADQHYGDRVKMAMAFADALNEEGVPTVGSDPLWRPWSVREAGGAWPPRGPAGRRPRP